MKRNKDDVIAEIKTARDEARIKAHAYRRADAAILAYNQALAMFERATEHQIPDMAATALADFEYARDNDPTATEMALAVLDGRRDALNTVVDLMDGGWTE